MEIEILCTLTVSGLMIELEPPEWAWILYQVHLILIAIYSSFERHYYRRKVGKIHMAPAHCELGMNGAWDSCGL